MDKNEYRAKMDELNDLVDRQDYKSALEIVDSIDWRRVRSARTLCMVGEIYEANKRYEDSRRLLMLAHHRAPIGKTVLYRLVELSIKMGNFEEAIEYYNQFVDISPNDNTRYILKYKISRGKRSPIREQIAILEDYKEREYTERWAYELARLYAKARMKDKCVEECDDLILWFSEGKYVTKAMELKMKYEPLTPSQMEKYKHRYIEPSPEALAAKSAATASAIAAATEAASRLVSSSQIPLPRVESTGPAVEQTTDEMPVIESVRPKTTAKTPEQMSVFTPILETTGVLQDKIAKGIRDVLAGGVKPEEASVEEKTEEEKTENYDSTEDTQDYVVKELEPDNIPPARPIEATVTGAVVKEAVKAEQSGTTETAAEAQNPKEEFDLEALLAETANEFAQAVAENKAEEADAAEVKEEPKAELEEASEEPKAEPEEAAEEPEAEPEEAAEEPKAESEEATEEPKMEPEKAAEEPEAEPEEVVEEPKTEPEETAEEPEAESEGVVEEPKTEPEEAEAEPEEAAEEPEAESEEVVEEPKTEPEETAEEPEAESVETAEVSAEEPELILPDLPVVEEESIISEEEVGKLLTEVSVEEEPALQGQTVDLLKALEAAVAEVAVTSEAVLEEKNLEEEDIPADDSDIKVVVKPEPKDNVRQVIDNTVETIMRHHLTKEEQNRLFTYFNPIPGMTDQITSALDVAQGSACEKTSRSGNIIITGRAGSGKTRLSEGVIKAICKERKMKGAKVAYMDAEKLNSKDPAFVVDKLSGGFLVVEHAAALKPEIVENLSKAMEFKTNRLTVILEDLKPGIQSLEDQYPDFIAKFDSRIVIPVFTNDELVSFAKTYSKEMGYKIDDMAVLALYTLIGDNQNDEDPVTIGQVKEMMDDAIKHASRGGRRPGKKVAKRHLDETGRIMLYEKDFDV